MTEIVYFMCHHKIISKTVGIRTKIAPRQGMEDKSCANWIVIAQGYLMFLHKILSPFLPLSNYTSP